MSIDNFAEAQDLADRLQAATPFQVRPGFQLLETFRENGVSVNEQTWLTVDHVIYGGDEGGILCTISVNDGENVTISSLTHLKMDPEHPLALEVIFYQRQRIARLKLSRQGTQRKPKPGRKQKKK